MQRRPMVLLGVLFAALLLMAVGYRMFLAAPRLPEAPLSLVPKDATAVAVFDVDKVVSSPLWSSLVVARGGTQGLARLAEECQLNLLAELRQIVAFTRGSDPHAWEQVGLVARGPLNQDRLTACIGKVVKDGGGTIRHTEIEGIPAIAGGKGDSRALFLGEDGVAIGSEPTVRDIVRTVRSGHTLASSDLLRHLFEDVAEGRAIGLASRLPASFRGVIARATGITIDGARGFALGADLADPIRIGAAMETMDASSAESVEKAIRKALDAAQREPVVALTVAGAALRRVRVATTGTRLVMTVELSARQVAELVELAEEWLARAPSPSEASGATSPITGSSGPAEDG